MKYKVEVVVEYPQEASRWEYVEADDTWKAIQFAMNAAKKKDIFSSIMPEDVKFRVLEVEPPRPVVIEQVSLSLFP